MRVLMLGWEFPPFISGGLGTACYGLTKGLSRLGVDVTFVLPRHVDPAAGTHVKLLSPTQSPAPASLTTQPLPMTASEEPPASEPVEAFEMQELEHVTFRAIPADITSPYPTHSAERVAAIDRYLRSLGGAWQGGVPASSDPLGGLGVSAAVAAAASAPAPPQAGNDYSGDVVAQSQRYAAMCAKLVRHETFDVIHAHDWMTYPAGLTLAQLTGKPLVVHVHSTEFDRAGENIHRGIYEIERRGMHGAMTVICVSHLTASTCVHRYAVPEAKVKVVYNGIDTNVPAVAHPYARIMRGDKIVLFLGRITMQKGPEYFVAAARKVLEKIDNVKFVMAGSGDMFEQVIRMADVMGIGHKVLFTGFLRGPDVERIFRMADVYVMPSVSEPFGIAPLEAIRHDVPVIISKSSGVSEVLQHVLKVDFWDIDDMANKIIAVLRHPPLSQTLREHADMEVRSLTWDGAAARCVDCYEEALAGMQAKVPVR
jgi:glycosyltransferase involved in cell wall biosynthesis